MQTRTPIKNPFAASGRMLTLAKGFRRKTVCEEIIPEARPKSRMDGRGGIDAGATTTNAQRCIFPLDQGAACRYSDHANKLKVDGRHLKTCFLYFPHPTKSFSVQNSAAVRPETLSVAFAILGGFLFSGGTQ